MLNSKDFAERLQGILDFYGISATVFSEEIKVNRSTVSHLLSGRNKPSLDVILKVLKKFPEVDLDWLVSGKGNFPPDTGKTASSAPPAPKPASLFDEAANAPTAAKPVQKQMSEIEHIVIFYKNGSFKVYRN